MNWKSKKMDDNDGSGIEELSKVIAIEKGQDSSIAGNKIYFYQDVNRDSVLTLNKQIDEMSKQLKMIQFTFDMTKPPPIELHICSDGGEIYGAMAAVDKIISNSVPIHTYCEGIVASAATLLSVSGKRRFITKNSCMLIHQVSSGLWGNYMEFKDEIKNLELIMSLIKGVYLKTTKFNPDELDNILGHDLVLSPEKCLEYGLIDIIQ